MLDASVAASWLLGERPPLIGLEILALDPQSPLVVPSHWPLEISNMLHTHLRASRISVVDFHAIMDRLDLLKISVRAAIDIDEIGPLAQFSVTHGLTTYDATYVQLAMHEGATLATLDNAMRRAASTLNIPLLPA